MIVFLSLTYLAPKVIIRRSDPHVTIWLSAISLLPHFLFCLNLLNYHQTRTPPHKFLMDIWPV